MSSLQIQTLLQPPDQAASVQHAISYLNSSFPTLREASSGSALQLSIDTTKSASDDYNAQLASSRTGIDKLIQSTRNSTKEHIVNAQELSLLRHSLADELTGLSEELESVTSPGVSEPSLLEEIETLHRNLKELQSVKEYVQVIHRALQLSEDSVKNLQQASPSSPITEASVADYVLLQELVTSIQRACTQVQSDTGQDLKLLSFLKDLLDKTWIRIKDVLSSSLLSAAEKLHWPMPVDYAAASLESRKAFESAFANFLGLQEIGEKLQPAQEANDSNKPFQGGLYPLQALIRPVALRFKYHFEGTRQTNRLDKPEWYFAHILNVSHEHRPFLEIVIQRLLQSSKYTSISAWREFTRLLLPIVSRKLRRSMPALLSHPPLLAHTVYQALAFDDALRDAGFSLVGTEVTLNAVDDVSAWEGTSDIVLGSKEWFDAWLEGERKFAEDQYNEIIISADAWQLSDDAEEDTANVREVRPTNSARRVKVLIEQITDRYRPLPRFLHKTRFLTAVQVPILELYHTRISDSLDAFETLSSFLVRAVPGSLAGQAGHGRDTKNMTAGVEGTQRLIKAYVSARWIAGVMAAWGEDMFFLELWHQICEKASLRSRVEDINSLPNPNVVNEEGTIFEELVTQYNKLAERTESMLVRQICGEVEADLKAHIYKQSNASPEGASEDIVLSQTLLGPIARFSAHLSLLRKTLPVPTVVGLYRKVGSHIALHVLQRQVLYQGRRRMNSLEGRVILDETRLWVETSRMALGGSVRRVEGPWERLLEAGRLLSLEGDAFERAVNAVRLGKEGEYEKLVETVGIGEMSNEEVMDVLSVREDYPK
ncbi:TIP-1 family-domain-containing protein [Phellopilus nigrolimitatus]|nr:TIP-1 family-domain-containing protein [Phellopilus nigrolimitatus]